VTELQFTPSPTVPQADYRATTSSVWKRIFLGLFVGIALLIAAAFVVLPIAGKLFEVRAFRSPASSMCPTICLDERFLASMNAYRGGAPKRGDVIMHTSPQNAAPFIKRVIGVGGDIVSPGVHNEVLVNGRPLPQPAVCGNPLRSDVSNAENPPFEAVKIPDGYLFVVGDNLSNSYDSRFFGLVALNQVKGKPLFLYWSPGTSRIGCPIR
jgi:signal peptidase I